MFQIVPNHQPGIYDVSLLSDCCFLSKLVNLIYPCVPLKLEVSAELCYSMDWFPSKPGSFVKTEEPRELVLVSND